MRLDMTGMHCVAAVEWISLVIYSQIALHVHDVYMIVIGSALLWLESLSHY